MIERLLLHPENFTKDDHFFFEPGMALETVCNAPKDEEGVFKVLELRQGKINLVYIGYSTFGGLFNAIVNGMHLDNNPRKVGWPLQILKDKTEALDIYWYAMHNKGKEQEKQAVKMLKYCVAQSGELPKWNR